MSVFAIGLIPVIILSFILIVGALALLGGVAFLSWRFAPRSRGLGWLIGVLSVLPAILAIFTACAVVPWSRWLGTDVPGIAMIGITVGLLYLNLLLVAGAVGFFRAKPKEPSGSSLAPGSSNPSVFFGSGSNRIPVADPDPDPDPIRIYADAGANPPRTAPHEPAPGLVELSPHFPDLELLELIGQGGMGAVYRVRRHADAALLALKVVRVSADDCEGFADRFAREAEALTRLDHPHIVAIQSHGRTGPWCWLLMDLVEGANLRQVVATGRLSPAQTLALVPPLCAALQYAHDRGVVHRDIKPENILLDAAGNPRIVDFGLAKLRRIGDVQHTRTGAVLGTPHYMAPEQVEEAKDVDHRADIYALGVVVYELLTGGLPLGRFEPPSHRVAVDVRIDEVVLKALERDPERRWQQAGQVGRAVDAIDRSNERTRVEPVGTRNGSPPLGAADTAVPIQAWGMDVQTFCALLHLSQFAGFIIPAAGWILPLVMWLTCRHRHPDIDSHGRVVVNWLISALIYAIVCVALCFILIGIPLLIALLLIGFIFPIIGAVRAGRGEVWNYPLAIPFCGRGEERRSPSGQARSVGGIGCFIAIAIVTVVLLLAAVSFGVLFLAKSNRPVPLQQIDLSLTKVNWSAKDYESIVLPLVESLSSDRRRRPWPVEGKPQLIIGPIDIQRADRAFDEADLRRELARQLAERHLQTTSEAVGPEANANLELTGTLQNVANSMSLSGNRRQASRNYRLALTLKTIKGDALIWQDSAQRTITWP